MRSLESRRHRALDDVSDNEHLKEEFRGKMGNAGPLIYNDQPEAAMFSERDAGKATIDVSTAEKEAVYKELRAALMKDIEELDATSEKLKSL